MKSQIRIILLLLLLSHAVLSNAQVPKLSSLPSASATVFLDFDGHTVTGTAWNGTDTLYCAPSGLSNTQITEIFERVSEDYRPFNLNITTDSSVFLAAPIDKRTRVIITVTNGWYPGVGGISFVGSFVWGDDTPCFVFSAALLYNSKYISEAVAHEAGHTFGLFHQALYDSSCNLITSYNTGTGSGETGWAPIMGVGYYQNMTLWNHGPMPYGCSDQQDDLFIITGYNGFWFRTDDHANTFAAATNETFTNDRFDVNGVIEKNTDQDMFKFIIPVDGEFKLDAIPYNVGANNAGSDLDMQVTLYNSSQTAINVYNPANTLSLQIDTSLEAGTYYAKVEGKGNQFAPNYASLGSYSLQATLANQGVVLALHELTLKGAVNGSTNDLSWVINADEKIVSQTIEQSTNGHDFTPLITPTDASRSYSYSPGTGETILYRLNVVFDNGKQYYSNTISLHGALGSVAKPQLNGNVITDQYIHVSNSGNYSYRVLDMTGKLISKGQLANGNNSINTNVTSAGIYLINFTNGKDQWTEKFVKQ
ncbi:MAG: T9SS type A sorting domain-containing protein [Chitinophagaceae bacterium]